MSDPPFKGATKSGQSWLSPLERRLATAVLPRIPAPIETYHLTWLTLVWCGGILYFDYRAIDDLRWLWATNVMIVLHWLTDFFDGKLGKYRGTGLVTWGFYLDHVFDYVFLCALIVGYAFLMPPAAHLWIMVLLAATGGFMVHTFLAFSATDRFSITQLGFGPTEFRLAVIGVNALIVEHGTSRMVSAMPWVTIGALMGLAIVVLTTQRRLWQRDMRNKRMPRC
jgi:phosphatidylglycerophosphate synthase